VEEKPYLSTKEVARLLGLNEKMVYNLVAEKGLPATKVTGKWLFPRKLVEQWLDSHTMNYPASSFPLSSPRLIIFAGSHDILLDRTLGLFNRLHPDYLTVFGNVGSEGGLKALSQGLCHVASSHLLQDDESEYNFEFAHQEFRGKPPATVNFCRREQGLIIARGNPRALKGISDLSEPDIQIANRPKGTGTRRLFDLQLSKAGIKGKKLKGYDRTFRSHLDVGLEVLSGRADVAPAIRPVADLLGLEFIPLRWERFDFLIAKDCFFERRIQLFLGMLHEPTFLELASPLAGYDMSLCGRMVYPQQTDQVNGGFKNR
jgi:excisionase family DNA binding protein